MQHLYNRLSKFQDPAYILYKEINKNTQSTHSLQFFTNEIVTLRIAMNSICALVDIP